MEHDAFLALADAVCTPLSGIDRTTLFVAAESSDFIRFNHAAVRQALHVAQCYGTVAVVAGQRRAAATLILTGRLADDAQALLAARATLAADLPLVPEDAFLLLPDLVVNTTRTDAGRLAAPRQVIAAVARHAAGADLVGFYAGGPMQRGFADSRGQRNWHSVQSFHFEWSLVVAADQAVKASYAGTAWEEAAFAARMEQARAQCALLALPRKTLAPGAYRAWFSPVAVADLLSTLSWGGFGLKNVKTGVSTLIQAHRGEARFAPGVQLSEDTAHGIAPRFQADGFVRPDAVPLVQGSRIAGTLVSPRSAKEYGEATNAGDGEAPQALSLAGGTLAQAQVLSALGTGVYLNNLHYLNYSDRQACRITGMTRFACFWVEDARIVAPIAVMRFDDSLLRMFGSGLLGLGENAELVPESATYGARQLSSVTCPGALVEDFRFTL